MRNFGGTAGFKSGIFVKGTNKVLQQLDSYEKKIQSRIYVAMKRSLIMVESSAIRLVKSGYYQPAIDTGTMKNRITNNIVKFNYEYIIGEVGTNVYYAIYVHEGTKQKYTSNNFNSGGLSTAGWHMPPRPFLVDALRKEKNNIIKEFRKAFAV